MSKWEVFNKNGAKGIYSRDLNWPDIVYGNFDKIKEFKVKPNGIFPDHIDGYHHLILVKSGKGIFRLEKENYEMKGVIAVIAGQMHGYRNESNEDLILLVCNTKPILFE